MKNNKKIVLLSLLGLLMTGCGKTEVPTTSNNTATEVSEVLPDYYLAGNINIEGGEKKFAYDGTSQAYSLKGISLKRGDSFVIRGVDGNKKNATTYNFASLASKDGFEQGNNNYINVLNEGIYDLSLKDNALTLVKTGSNYHAVKLVYEDGTEALDFAMNEDFTFSLENASLRYRQKFYIDMDGEKLGFDSMAFNPAYYKAFRFGDNDIEAIKKGLFNVQIDFSLKQPLVFSSNAIKEENTAPVDGDAYKKYIKNFSNQFARSGNKYTATSITTEGGMITKKEISETVDNNQHYIENTSYKYSADQTAEGAITEDKGKENADITKKEAVFNSENYYEIITHGGSSVAKPSVTGAIIKDDSEENKTENADEPETTIVTNDRKYIKTVEARNKMISYQAAYQEVNTLLSDMIAHAHVSGNSYYNDQQILDNLKIESEYVGDIGDVMKLKFTNHEMVYNTYGTSYYATNVLSITVDEEGKITDGSYQLVTYSGTYKQLFDDEKNLVADPSNYIAKTEDYTFHMEYGERKSLDEFEISLKDNIASEVETAQPSYEFSSLISTLDMEQFAILPVEPTAPLDLANYKIMSYDSKYFKLNYNKSLAGKGVVGTTTITIGTEYNMVTYDVQVTLTYQDYTSASQLGDLKVDGKTFNTAYLNQTYDVVLAPSAGYDPNDIVITPSSDAISLTDFNDEASRKETGAITFKLKVNRIESGVTIKIASKAKPTISKSVSLKLSDPWTKEKIAGSYATTYENIKSITLNSDGTGNASINTKVGYNDPDKIENFAFTYDIDASGNIALKSSDSGVEEFAASVTSTKDIPVSSNSGNVTYQQIKVSSMKVNGKSYLSYAKDFTAINKIFTDSYTIVDEAGKAYTFVKSEMDSYNDGYIYFSDGTTTSKFELVLPSSSYTGSATCRNYYADITSSSYTKYSGSYTYDNGTFKITFDTKVFTFTPKAA